MSREGRHVVASLGLGMLLVASSAPTRAAEVTPIRIGSGKQLLFDHKFIEASEDVRIVMNPPQKLGPVLKPDRRWEDFRITSYFTVLQDGERFRMYYSCFSEDQWNFAPADVTWRDYAFLCYAESDDGIHWRKPSLGIVEYDGSKDNNIIARSIVDGTVFLDPSAAPEDRYKMLHTIGPHDGGLRVSSSPDGVHFHIAGQAAIAWGPDSQQNMFFDTRLGKYVAYLRARPDMGSAFADADSRRQVVRAEVSDLRDWGDPHPRIVLRPDEADPDDVDFYTNACVQYPWADDAYFMFPATYHHFPKEYGNDGLLDVSAAASRDGVHWQRSDRRPYVALGTTDEFDAMFIMMGVGMVRHGDTIIQFYNGIDFGHGGTRKESKYKVESPRRWGWIGAVAQRLDGFYSADAAYTGGWLITPPLVFAGDRLQLNINTSSAGSATVELRDENNLPIKGFTHADADRIMTNNVRHTVSWKGRTDVSALTGRAVRLHIAMRSAKLSGFQFLKK